jgi:hypothetical protein
MIKYVSGGEVRCEAWEQVTVTTPAVGVSLLYQPNLCTGLSALRGPLTGKHLLLDHTTLLWGLSLGTWRQLWFLR